MRRRAPLGRAFERYVAIGDSTTEGLDDPDGRGGYRGWANRFAERIAAAQDGVLYANLAVRGLQARQVRERQLGRALSMRPDVATVVAGTNDLVRPRCDIRAVAEDVERMQRALVDAGATVLSSPCPTSDPCCPWRVPSPRARAP